MIKFNKSKMKISTILYIILYLIYPVDLNATYNNLNTNSDASTNKSDNIPSFNSNFNNSESSNLKFRSLLSQSDEYVMRNQKQCFQSHSLVSCIKYKASKIVWKLATNGLGYFPNEYARDLRESKKCIHLIQLQQPSDIVIFSDARTFQGDNEFMKLVNFLKRAAEAFGQNHAIQLSLTSDTGARISDGKEEQEPRGIRKKKKKWLIILPLIILMKIAHLKMTMIALFMGVLGINILLVGGMGWLIHYLKFKTLCKIHPQLVEHHSHVYDSDPADYSNFVGSSFPSSSYHSSSGSNPYETGGSSQHYSKDWATSKTFTGHNFLDTISKRVQ